MTPYRAATEVAGYHAHVYFEPDARDVAERLRTEIGARFAVELGRLHGEPMGPHPLPMFQVEFGCEDLVHILPWLMLNRSGLSVMIHPRTGDEIADHLTSPFWLGTPLRLDVGFIRDWLAKHGPSVAATSI